ncbi:MAG: YiiX/YebB-like N1pC/P60 family cysteine hydrolase [Candidatus Berkiellales bacterium]
MMQKMKQRFFEWITKEEPNTDVPLYDFERIRYEVRPCDVLLIEGRSRVSEVIKQITQSSWSHSCLYIGRLHDVDDIALRQKIAEHFKGDHDVQFVIEGYLGKGAIVSPLDNYQSDHIRICRPRGLSRQDSQKVIAHATQQLGFDYDVRQIFDLARFLVPWSILPRRFRSSLFEFHTGESTRTVCSTLIAEAFGSIDFPILPVVKQHEETGIELYARNPRIFTPRDFDYSPYFDIIKHPFISFAENPYRNLPWNRQGLISPDGESIYDPRQEKLKPKTKMRSKLKSKIKSKIKTLTHRRPSVDEDDNKQTSSHYE